jgi:chromosome segregation ATPase
VSFVCPQCKTAQIIPTHSPFVSSNTPQETANATLAEAQPGRRAADGTLWNAQERLWENHHQSAEQAVALIERDQRISALRAECDWLASQLDEERQRRQALEPELDLARGEWAAAEKRANEYETGFANSSARLQQTEDSLRELTQQLELVKTERSEAVLELAHHQETFAELNLQLEKAVAGRVEMEQILGRARSNLDRTTADLATAEADADQATAEVSQQQAAIAHLRAELGLAVAERDKLQGLVREDHDLAEFVETKTDRDRLDAELKETQARVEGMREKIESLTAEREGLKRERTDLQLKVAALRDAHDDTQLQQDNEVLRRMVERLNEQLKEAQPEIAKRKRREASGGVVGGLARAVASRVFVSDPDVVEGR